MSDDIYQVIESGTTATLLRKEAEGSEAASNAGQPFDKDKWAADKKAEREQAYAMIDKATERVAGEPRAFLDYLDIMARFPRLSVANTLLVSEQMPEATRLGSFDYWKRNGASVKKGQSAVIILEPGDEYTRGDGTIGVSFNVRKVFDERQTTARHTEPRHPSTQDALFALVDSSPVGIKAVEGFENPLAQAHYSHETRTISVKKNMEPQALFKALALELAHATLAERNSPHDYEANRESALMAAYVVAKRSGIDTSGMVAAYTPRSEDGSLQQSREELGRIRDVAKAITDRMGKTLEAMRGQETQPKQQTAGRGDRDAR
jgi:hypothetical protein